MTARERPGEAMATPAFDFAALTPAQLRVLGAISINQDGGHPNRVLLALAEKGMIVGHKVNMGGFPPMTVVRWEMPIAAHMAWCQWCSDTVTDEDLEQGP